MDCPTSEVTSVQNKKWTKNIQEKLLKKENKNESRTFSIFSYDLDHILLHIGDKDYFSTLPQEMILNIFEFLSILNLRTCALVSKLWHKLSFSAELWKRVTLNSIHIEVFFLERILNCNVKTIFLSNTKVDIQKSLRSPFFKTSRFNSLQEIALFSTSMKLELFEELINLSPNLKELDVSYTWNRIGKNFFRQVLRLRFLETLKLRNVRIENITEIVKMLKNAEKFEKFKTISLFYLYLDTGIADSSAQSRAFFENLLGLCQNLEVLNLPDQCINAATFKCILKMKQLNYLNIRNTALHSNFTLPYTENYKKLVNLRTLYIDGTDIPERLLTNLLNLSTNLEILDIGGVITHSILEQLLKMKNLKDLSFSDADLRILNDFQGCEMFSELRVLRLEKGQHFNTSLISKLLSYCSKLNELEIFELDVDSEVFSQILEMQNLEKLELLNIKTSVAFKTICNSRNYEKFKKLRSLNLAFDESEPGRIVAQHILLPCKNLTYLYLDLCPITEVVWRCITSMAELEKLYIYNLETDNFNISNVDNLPKFLKLKNITVYYMEIEYNPRFIEALLPLCCNIDNLRLSYTFLTDTICRSITSMKELEYLSLNMVPGISDEKISDILSGCPKLTRNQICIHNRRLEQYL